MKEQADEARPFHTGAGAFGQPSVGTDLLHFIKAGIKSVNRAAHIGFQFYRELGSQYPPCVPPSGVCCCHTGLVSPGERMKTLHTAPPFSLGSLRESLVPADTKHRRAREEVILPGMRHT